MAIVQHPEDFKDFDAVRGAQILGDPDEFVESVKATRYEAPVIELVGPHALVPVRTSEEAAGANVSAAEDCTVQPHCTERIYLGFKLAAPEGTYARLAPHSGLAYRHSVYIGAGVIDRDYASICTVILLNHGDKPFVVRKCDRIAQLMFEKIDQTPAVEGKVQASVHDPSGFGSYGASWIEPTVKVAAGRGTKPPPEVLLQQNPCHQKLQQRTPWIRISL